MDNDERNARELCMKAERNNKLSCINEIIRTIQLKPLFATHQIDKVIINETVNGVSTHFRTGAFHLGR